MKSLIKYKIGVLSFFVVVTLVILFSFRNSINNVPPGANQQERIFLYKLNPKPPKFFNFEIYVQKLTDAKYTSLNPVKIGKSRRFSSNNAFEYYEVNDAEGRFAFCRDLTKYTGDYRPALPDPKSAAPLAEKFLRGMDLFPENPDQIKLIHSGGLRADDGKGNVIDKMITLTYGRELDKIPVIGKGSKIVVQVGENGKIEGVIRKWKEIENKREIRREELITEKEQTERLSTLINSEFGKKAKFELVGKSLTYYDNAGMYLQPVMAYEVLISVGTNEKFKYLGIVPLMRKPAEQLNLTTVDPDGLKKIRKIDSVNSIRNKSGGSVD